MAMIVPFVKQKVLVMAAEAAVTVTARVLVVLMIGLLMVGAILQIIYLNVGMMAVIVVLVIASIQHMIAQHMEEHAILVLILALLI
tara:strand:- start:67 stop:324 length:258 start_codon:yes stop_codon:yes gene_type:complete